MYENMAYGFFTANEIKPAGWIKAQLRLQADGLCGNLDKVWKDVRDSAWIGGDCEGWERVPYWLDGFIPLAYLLEDEDMICRAKKYIDAIIMHQQADGWICPCENSERANYDTWAVLLILKVLVVYYDCSKDERIESVVRKCLENFDKHLNFQTLRNWGAARWFEGLIAIYWLYERTHENWLLDLAKKLKVQGFDWKSIFNDDLPASMTTGWDYYTHVVNIAMMLKSEALASLMCGGEKERFAEQAYSYLMKHHSTAAGHFTGDETLSGDSPIQGTELCGVVEAMYSYEWLFAVSGNAAWLDRLETLAFNALPAAISPDMWTHQYDQMTNQAACFPMAKQPFRTNNNEAHLFGLEPNFGCCTANFGQGFPKLVLSSFMKTDTSVMSCIPIPSVVETNIGGANVRCELISEYPFRRKLTYKVSADKPAEFTLSVRIPGSAKGAQFEGKYINGGEILNITRKWENNEITVMLDFETKIAARPNDMVCVWHGPLLYSIPIKEKWERVEYTKNGVERKYPYCDYFVYPCSKWNYALADSEAKVRECSFAAPFTPEKPPVKLMVKVKEIEWDFNNGHCDAEPKSRIPVSGEAYIDMIPYGCTNLRMTEIPLIK